MPLEISSATSCPPSSVFIFFTFSIISSGAVEFVFKNSSINPFCTSGSSIFPKSTICELPASTL